MDYELYCLLRDKIKNLPDEFEVYQCEHCVNFNHFSFTCPKLHYIPLFQHIINKQLYRQKVGKNSRMSYIRQKIQSLLPFQFCKIAKKNNQDQKRSSVSTARSLSSKRVGVIQSKFTPQLISQSLHIIQNGQNAINAIEQTYPAQVKINVEITKQIIEMQFVKNYKKQNFIDQVWLLNSDLMTNFNNYFPNDNPHLIRQKFNQQQRVNKAMKKIAFIQSCNSFKTKNQDFILDNQQQILPDID